MNQLLIASGFMAKNYDSIALEQSNTQLIKCMRFITGIKQLHENFDKQLRDLLGLSSQREIFSKQILTFVWHDFKNLERFKVTDQQQLQNNSLAYDLLNAVPFRLHATYQHTPDPLVQKHFGLVLVRLKEYFHRKRSLIGEQEAEQLKSLILSGSTVAGQTARMVQFLHSAKLLLPTVNAQVYGSQIMMVVNNFVDQAILLIVNPLYNEDMQQNLTYQEETVDTQKQQKEQKKTHQEELYSHSGFGKGKGKGCGKGKGTFNEQNTHTFSTTSLLTNSSVIINDDVFDVRLRAENKHVLQFDDIICQSDVVYDFQLSFRTADAHMLKAVNESFYQNADKQLLAKIACSGKIIHKLNQLRIENDLKPAESDFSGFIRDVYTVLLYYNAMYFYCGNHLQFQTLISISQARFLSELKFQCKFEAHMFQSVLNTNFSTFYTMHEVDTLFGGTRHMNDLFEVNSKDPHMFICQPVGIVEIMIETLKSIQKAVETHGSTFLLIIPMIYLFDKAIYDLLAQLFPLDSEVLEWSKQPYPSVQVSNHGGSGQRGRGGQQPSQIVTFKTFCNQYSEETDDSELSRLRYYFRYACYAQTKIQAFIQTSSSKNAQYNLTRVMLYYISASDKYINDKTYTQFFQQWYKASGGVL